MKTSRSSRSGCCSWRVPVRNSRPPSRTERQDQGSAGRIGPAAVVKPYEPVSYKAFDQPDPSAVRRSSWSRNRRAAGRRRTQADLNRPKEPLKPNPLESLKMVGGWQQRKAILRWSSDDTGLYRSKIGNYMGQNFGLITTLPKTKVHSRGTHPGCVGDLDRTPQHFAVCRKSEEGK